MNPRSEVDADLGQADFGQNLCFHLFAHTTTIPPQARFPEGGTPKGGPKFRAFFRSLATIFILALLGVLPWNFGGV